MGRFMSMITCFAMGVLLCTTLAWTQAGHSKVADEVISITKAEWSALMSKNIGKAMQDVHKDCTMWVPEFPNRLNGKDAIYKFSDARATGTGSLIMAEMANEHVQVFGDVAILSYNFMGMNKDKEGKTKPSLAKSSRVYLNQGGKWLLVHANFAPIGTDEE